MKYNDVSLKNQYNERMASLISTDSLLSSAMVAFHLKKLYRGSDKVSIHANFPYRDDNPYFSEKYLTQDYSDADGRPTDYWGASYPQDRRDEEMQFLMELSRKGCIKKFYAYPEEEENLMGAGMTSNPFLYEFTITDNYLPVLDLFMQLADARLIRIARESNSESPPIVNTAVPQNHQPTKKIDIHLLEPEHYNPRTGALSLSPTNKVAIAKRGNARKANGQKFDQCHLLGCLFRNVNTLKNGVKISVILGVNSQLLNNKHEKKVRNLIQEINDKVAEVGGPNNLVKMQNQKVFINSSYLA